MAHENGMALLEVEAAVGAVLAQEAGPSPERIRLLVRGFQPLCAELDDGAVEVLARKFEARHGVTMTVGSVLDDSDSEYQPWLPQARSDISPYYWDRYRDLLASQGLSGRVIATLDEVTDRILGLLEDPRKPAPWDRRGMVVGHVQSGKTANYTGLVCKAADAGYRLIIVIAGVHNSLRNQTQRRIDEGFVGRDSARLLSKKDGHPRAIGVGRFDQTRHPVTFTNSLRDFNRATATSVGVSLRDLNEPAVLVIKKNASTLKHLLAWLREYRSGTGETIDLPMLVIDDEADNASINISHKKGEVARINGQIRSLLALFDRSGYVGYTATPFANVFIDPDAYDERFEADLFPRNFIVSLDPPTNYFGAQTVFVEHPDRFIRHIDDNADLLPVQHKIDFELGALPESLITALRVFLVACGVRAVRGAARDHVSMLVNASRFTNVQAQIRSLLHERLTSIQRSLRVNGGLEASVAAVQDSEIEALRRAFEREYAGGDEDWAAVLGAMVRVVPSVQVIEVNSKSAGTLDYAAHDEDGLRVIAVGGFSLSRGLTLEGLTVSYFLRNSMMYDTLMQMARWFGFRDGYSDLCRVWMPEEAEGWYLHVAESTELLRDDIRRMEQAGATPEEFGLKVRSHPDSLMVVARNKIGTGERVVVRVGLANQFIETAALARGTAITRNRSAAARLGAGLTELGLTAEKPPDVSGWLLSGAPVGLITAFIESFVNDPASLLTEPGPVLAYIDARRHSELAEWDLLLPTLASPAEGGLIDTDTFGVPVFCQRRTAGRKTTGSSLRIGNKQRVASRGIEKAGLSPAERARAEDAFREQHPETPGGSHNYPDRIYRAERSRGLLVVHMLQVLAAAGGRSSFEPTAAEAEPIVAWGISFPPSGLSEERVEYVVNTTWLQENQRQFDDDLGDDWDDGDA
jgi:hypothetical protein